MLEQMWAIFMNNTVNFFLTVLPSSGISPCGRTDGAVMPPTLGAALLCSSRAGSDMGLLSRNSIVHRNTVNCFTFLIDVSKIDSMKIGPNIRFKTVLLIYLVLWIRSTDPARFKK